MSDANEVAAAAAEAIAALQRELALERISRDAERESTRKGWEYMLEQERRKNERDRELLRECVPQVAEGLEARIWDALK